MKKIIIYIYNFITVVKPPPLKIPGMCPGALTKPDI
jgi:hypothetical protein